MTPKNENAFCEIVFKEGLKEIDHPIGEGKAFNISYFTVYEIDELVLGRFGETPTTRRKWELVTMVVSDGGRWNPPEQDYKQLGKFDSLYDALEEAAMINYRNLLQGIAEGIFWAEEIINSENYEHPSR